jgi:hypothetical protein
MKSQKNLGIILAVLMLAANTLKAQTIETNIEGLVIKNISCMSMNRLVGMDVINRKNAVVSGTLEMAIVDRDNDIVWRGGQTINVGGLNGVRVTFSYGAGSCATPNRLAFTVR